MQREGQRRAAANGANFKGRCRDDTHRFEKFDQNERLDQNDTEQTARAPRDVARLVQLDDGAVRAAPRLLGSETSIELAEKNELDYSGWMRLIVGPKRGGSPDMKSVLPVVVLSLACALGAQAQNRNRIWVPDVGTGTVTVLDMNGSVTAVYPVGGNPRGAAVDAAGNVWIARFMAQNSLARISADGTRIDTYPIGITSKTCAVDRDANVWVTNQAIDVITKVSPQGVVVGEFPTGDGPRVVAIDQNDDVWLTCKFSHELLKLDPQGNILFRTPVGHGPRGVAIADDGSAWVANLDSSTVSHVSATGELLVDLPVPDSPGGIGIDRRGYVWIASGGADVVTVLRPDGSIYRSIPTLAYGGHGALNVAPDGDGNVWILCKLSSTALKFNLEGRLLVRVDLNPNSRPEPFGDLTGALRAKQVDPNADDDSDGLSNSFELRNRSNPFVANDPAARAGNVNGAVGPIDASLRVNGSTGGDERRVHLDVGQPLAIRVRVSPAGPNPARYALYAYLGEVDSTTITAQPFGIGTSAIPTPLQGPNERVIVLFNTLGLRHSLGTPQSSSSLAPTTIGFQRGIHSRTVATIQGFLEDAAAPGGHSLSITNAITIDSK
jgi:streptogramin lyase